MTYNQLAQVATAGTIIAQEVQDIVQAAEIIRDWLPALATIRLTRSSAGTTTCFLTVGGVSARRFRGGGEAIIEIPVAMFAN